MSNVPKGQDIFDRTRAFALRVIRLYRAIEKDEVGRIIGKQVLKSGTSIGAIVEEAQAAQSTADFIVKMSLALKEARETRYWVTLVLDAELLSSGRLDPVLIEIEEIIKVLYTIIQNSKGN